MKKLASKKKYPFDSVESKDYLITELSRIESEGKEFFFRRDIQKIISTSDNWNGAEILEYFKLVQVNKFLNL